MRWRSGRDGRAVGRPSWSALAMLGLCLHCAPRDATVFGAASDASSGSSSGASSGGEGTSAGAAGDDDEAPSTGVARLPVSPCPRADDAVTSLHLSWPEGDPYPGTVLVVDMPCAVADLADDWLRLRCDGTEDGRLAGAWRLHSYEGGAVGLFGRFAVGEDLRLSAQLVDGFFGSHAVAWTLRDPDGRLRLLGASSSHPWAGDIFAYVEIDRFATPLRTVRLVDPICPFERDGAKPFQIEIDTDAGRYFPLHHERLEIEARAQPFEVYVGAALDYGGERGIDGPTGAFNLTIAAPTRVGP